MIFGRSAYAAYIKDWKELHKTRQDLSGISAQDEFAKWARLQRKVDKMQEDFDKLRTLLLISVMTNLTIDASRKRTAMAVEFGLAIVVRVLLYVGLFWYGVWKGRLVEIEDLTVPTEFFGPLSYYLALPYCEEGRMSISVLLIMSIVTFKHIFESLATI